MENKSSANRLSLIGMTLGILSAAYGAVMYLFVWPIMQNPYNGPAKAVIAVAAGIIVSIVALVISKTAQKNGATSKTFQAGIGTSTGGIIVCAALMAIVLAYINFVL